jgi:hypothetical protein
MSVTVGTLTIDLKANTASFSGSMDKMSHLSAKTANDIKRSLEKIAAAGLAMGAAIATGTAALITHSLDSADALYKLAQSAGTTTETLSILNYAAGLSNVSSEELGKGLEKLSKSAFSAQNGNQALTNVFTRLKVSATDATGHLKDSGVLFGEIATRFAGMADGAGKTALAMTLFGKAGAGLIPLLNQYGAEQQKVNEEAHRFGLVLSSSTAKLASDAHDNLDRLRLVFQGLGYSLLGATLPAISNLVERLVDVARNANIPQLAASFGATVTTAVNATADALKFAATHAHELKVALEAIAGLQLAKIAIPLLADLANGGLEKAAAGVGKFLVGFAGLGRVIPALTQFARWLGTSVWFIGQLAAEEGIASAAGYALSGAVAAIGGPIGVAVAAIAGIAIALYRFRNATFSLKGSTYELRDVWNAAWILMGRGLTWIGTQFGTLISYMRNLWSGFASWFSSLTIVAAFKKYFNEALDWARGILGKLTPDWVMSALDEAKRQRESASRPAEAPKSSTAAKLPAAEAEGIVKKKDPYGEEIATLDLAIKAQQAYIAVLDATPEAIASVASAEKAAAFILELNNKLTDAGHAKLTALQEATIGQKVALGESLKALDEYGKELVSQQHSSRLATDQARALGAAISGGEEATRRATVDNAILGLTYNRTADQIAAMRPELEKLRILMQVKSDVESLNEFRKALDEQQRSATLSATETHALAVANVEGDEATRRAAVSNAILALTYNKTADQLRALAPEIAKLRDTLTVKSNAEIIENTNREIFAIRQDIASRRGLVPAILDGEEAYRRAALAVKLYAVDQQIAAATDADVTKALQEKRQAIVDLTQSESNESDARAAKALDSPLDRYEEETAALKRQIGVLTENGKQTLTYGQAVMVAAKQQEYFNKLTDETVAMLLRSNSARDGVAAFFLDMQRQAKTTASIIYEALHSAFDKLSDNLTQLITGGKTSFAAMFQDIGKQVLNSSMRQGLQKGLGALGAKLGIGLPKIQRLDGQTEPGALWVRLAAQLGGGAQPAKATATAIPGLNSDQQSAPKRSDGIGGSIAGFLGSLLGSLVGAKVGGGSGGGESVTSSITYGGQRATGGSVTPDKAYLVNERGTEILIGASGTVLSNSQSRKMLEDAGGSNHYYSIDARGTDPVLTEQRTRVAIMAAHNSAVGTGFRVAQEHLKRTPQR